MFGWVLAHAIALVSVIFAVVLIGRAREERRSPSATIAWLLVLLLVPYLGALLFLLFAGRKMARQAATKKPLDSHGYQSDQQNDSIRRLLARAGMASARPASTCTLLTTPERAFDVHIDLIKGAKQTLRVATFILGSDPVGEEILHHLAARARAGVQVQLLLDGFGSLRIGRRQCRELTNAGGRVSYFMPVIHLPFRGRLNLRNHRKIIIADDRDGIIGGMNLATDYMGPPPSSKRFCDLSARVTGPVATDLSHLFNADWAFATKEQLGKLDDERLSPRLMGSEDGLLQLVSSGPDHRGDAFYDALLTAIFETRSRLWMATPYFVPNEGLHDALGLAARRGVDVRILMPKRSNHRLADLARGTYVRALIDAGVKFCLFEPSMMHAKCAVFDERLAILGSANLDMRSLFLNYEASLFIYDRTDIETLADWFENRFLNSSIAISQKRSFVRELTESVARLLGPQL